MQTPVVFFLVLSILVLVHEFGHFLAARLLGIRVDEFALGLPFTKALFSITRGETRYAIYPLLFGGFVRLHGEESQVDQEKGRSFWNRGKKQRLCVLFAGVAMNVVLAIVSFVALYTVIGVPQGTRDQVVITRIQSESPAALAGFKPNDKVVSVEDRKVSTAQEFGEVVKSWAGSAVNITVERGDNVPLFEGLWMKNAQTQVISVIPRANPPEGQGALGVNIADYPYLTTKPCPMTNLACPLSAIGHGFSATGLWLGRTVDGLRSIGQSLIHGKAPEGVAGPIGIYQLTDVVAQGGFLPILELVAILSVNLAVFNVLPIPALDGGRIFFIWLEAARRKRVSPELEQKINSIGMVVLLSLISLITLQDVIRLDVIQKLLGR